MEELEISNGRLKASRTHGKLPNMHQTATPTDLKVELNILEQQPNFHKLYTQICFCFSVADTSSQSAIVNRLTNGLEVLSTKIPWTAGQVINENPSEGNSGVYKIVSLESIPRLVVKDLRNDSSVPTMKALREANFPFVMLDESIFAPCSTLPEVFAGAASDSAPVLLVQANFITGGLVITFNGQHNTMDAAGQAHIIRLLSKACSTEHFTNEELSVANELRHDKVPLLDESYTPGPELAHQLVPPPLLNPTPEGPSSSGPLPSLPASKHTWSYFTFSSAALAALKSISLTSLPPNSASSFVSTDDALTAFIWQSITRVRLPRLQSSSTIDMTPNSIKLTRAVDVRRYLGISPSYPGLMQNMTYHSYLLSQLVSAPLGVIAANLRSAVDPNTSTLVHDTRALATVLSRSNDKSRISFTASIDLEKDIMLSSWSKFDFLWELEFGLGLGKPEAVRRPQFTPVESLIYSMPKARDRGVAVGMCLRDEDLEKLKGHEEFAKYAEYVG